jgi:hypothetical protein
MSKKIQVEMLQNRLLPTLRFALKSGGSPIDLTNKTVNFVLGRRETGETIIRRACTLLGAAKEGRCEFVWAAGDTSYPEDNLDGELELVLQDGRVQVVALLKVSIKPSLGLAP